MANGEHRVLDRRPSFDEQSRNFPIRTLLEPKPLRSYSWAVHQTFDQGSEGACVGYGWAHELAGRPAEVPGVTNEVAHRLYKAAQLVDEWPGVDYEGTSVLAGAKVVKAAGFMQEYRWAFDLNEVLMTLGYHGPVVLGINWWTGMFNPGTTGIITPTGSIAGGHCILANAVSVTKKLVRLHNSWGIDWGVFGECFISWDDLEKLLLDQGEACIPVGRDKVGTLP